MPKIGLQYSVSDPTLEARYRVVSASSTPQIDRDARLGSVINMGNRIEKFFLTAVQMMFPLFRDGCSVEI